MNDVIPLIVVTAMLGGLLLVWSGFLFCEGNKSAPLALISGALVVTLVVTFAISLTYNAPHPSKADIQAQAWEQYMEASK